MPKIQIKKSPVFVDMTAMCDVAFLLLTFFILTAKAKPIEPVEVMTPSSIVDMPVPETNVITIMVDKMGRVFMGMDNIGGARERWLSNLEQQFNFSITNEQQRKNFINGGVIPVPARDLPEFLAAEGDKKQEMIKTTQGIHAENDNTETNDFRYWLFNARAANENASIVIKADSKAPYSSIKAILNTLENQKIYRFSLLTSQGSRN